MITKITKNLRDYEISIWKDDSNDWWSCISGTYQGIYSESTDFGPFNTENEAYNNAVDYISEVL